MQTNESELTESQVEIVTDEISREDFSNTVVLSNYIHKIEKVFDIEKVINSPIDRSKIQSYYHDSNIGYNLVHSKEGSVHMAINYDGVFDVQGYYQQVIEITEHISKKNKILELGCGKGFNSFYLAKKKTSSNFYGIDISSKHLSYAKKKANGLSNLHFSYGDFHSINFDDSTFDIVFELESVCHSDNPEQLLKEVHRILKKGGKFILYEGFRSPNFDKRSDLQKKMAQLIEKSMAVPEGFEINKWLELAKNTGFKIKENEDISEAIMPNLIRFHRLARKYYKYTFLSKIILAILPKNLIKNTIAGLLMPFSIKQQVQTYNRIILIKK
jgi:ubiquinone/menaquinone biosynthesis C-methylase UbiE